MSDDTNQAIAWSGVVLSPVTVSVFSIHQKSMEMVLKAIIYTFKIPQGSVILLLPHSLSRPLLYGLPTAAFLIDYLHGCRVVLYFVVVSSWGPFLLTWFTFNPSMDK